jgi:hypothetical protein
MSASKLKLQYSGFVFEAEGEPSWIESQLEKFNSRVDSLRATTTQPNGNANTQIAPATVAVNPPPSGAPVGNLASFLIAKSATVNQVRKFLVTAEWLHQKGTQVITTTMVAKALSDYRQSRLGNPSDCLGKNIGKGYCEKTEGGFFVTPEGRASIGTATPVPGSSAELEESAPSPSAENEIPNDDETKSDGDATAGKA